MRFSVTSPARQPGSQLIDLNLVPLEYRPKPFPILTAGLGLLVVGSLVLLYALLYAKTYSDLELTQLNRRLAQAQVVVQSATGDPAALAQKEQLKAMRDDYRVLAQRQINWGDVLQTVGDVPPSILLKSINQAGFGVSVTGSAADQSTAAAYLDKLRSSGLFVNASIQVQPSNAPGLFATPTPLPTPPPTQEPTQVSIQPAPLPVPPAQPVQPEQPPAAPIVAQSQPLPPAPPPRAPVAPAPAAIPPVASATKVISATTTPIRAATGTTSPTVTPTPQFNYALISSQQIPSSNPYASSSGITGQVIDLAKKPVVGVTIEIDSEGSPPWSIQQTTDTNGNFSFSVTHGKFKVFVVDPSTQPAVDLYTGADGQAGTYSYQLTFQQTFSGTPQAVSSTTPTATPTVAVTATPIVPGQNVANRGCATAYMVQNGQVLPVPGNSSPFLAIDNNTGTEWNAGASPSNGTQIIWQWQVPQPVAPGQATCASGYGSGLSDTADQIVAFQLIPDQNPSGTTDHELWLYSDTGCSQNLQSTNTPYYTWNQSTSAGQVLPLNVSLALPIRCVIVRTITDPSFVAWEDVQIYQALPPPKGFPTLTGTPANTFTPGPSSTPSLTPTLTATTTGTQPPTATFTPTSTPSATASGPPPVPNERNVASLASVWPTDKLGQHYVGPASCTGTPLANDPCNVIDANPNTAWGPVPGSTDPQGVYLQFPPATPGTAVDHIQVLVRAFGTPETVTYAVQMNTITLPCTTPTPTTGTPPSGPADDSVVDCIPLTPFATPFSLFSVAVSIYHSGNSDDGCYGIRDVYVYQPSSQLPLETQTPTSKHTATPSPTPTITSTPSATPTGPTSTSTATATPTPPVPTCGGLQAQRALAGRGQGPGAAPSTGPSQTTPVPTDVSGQPGPAGQSPATAVSAPVSGPVDFTVVLEVASGKGY
jgi:Tfp pilus assembly protein PilN